MEARQGTLVQHVREATVLWNVIRVVPVQGNVINRAPADGFLVERWLSSLLLRIKGKRITTARCGLLTTAYSMLNICHPTRERLTPQLKVFTCPWTQGTVVAYPAPHSVARFLLRFARRMWFTRNYSMPTTNHRQRQSSRRWLRITLAAASDLITAG